MIDHAALDARPAETLAETAAFLGLPPRRWDVSSSFNTRDNRGVLTAASERASGGRITAVARTKTKTWAYSKADRRVLERYYEAPNRDLAALLDGYGLPVPAFARPTKARRKGDGARPRAGRAKSALAAVNRLGGKAANRLGKAAARERHDPL